MGKARGFGGAQKPPPDEALVREALEVAAANLEAGRHTRAAGIYRQILERWPERAGALHGLGVVHHLEGDHEQAALLVEQATQRLPGYAQAHHNLGHIRVAQGRFKEAIRCYERAIALKPGNAEAHLALGYALEADRRFLEALGQYERATALAPDLAEAHYNLGNVLDQLGQPQRAETAYRAALALQPDHGLSHNNLGHLLQERGDLAEAEACYRRALTLAPDQARIHTNLGTVLEAQGQMQEALFSYEQALAIDPLDTAARWRVRLALPPIYRSETEIAFWRERFAAGLEALCANTPLATAAERERALAASGSQVNFYLQYQGLDDTDLQGGYGNLVARVLAASYPQWAGDLPVRPPKPGEKIRVGYASAHLLGHSGTRWLLGWLRHHDRSRFEIFCYHSGPETDAVTAAFKSAADHFHHLPGALEPVCGQVFSDRLHVLVYPDIGMEPLTTQMAALRLAPVQCAAWGHPVTTGLPTIDYYLSGEAMEPPDNPQRHYSETLVRLPRLGVCYPRPAPPPPNPTRNRAFFGLEDEQVLYLCCQSLFKYLPQHDGIFAQIACQLPAARFVFIAHPSEKITAVFRERLKRAFAARSLEWSDFCHLLPRQNYTDYLHLVQLADVFLDSFAFSGGNTSLEALALGLPVVTCPGFLMRSRLAAAALQGLGLKETIARDGEHYVEIALRLGIDPLWRQQIQARIDQNLAALFEDTACVSALEKFLEQVVSGPE